MKNLITIVIIKLQGSPLSAFCKNDAPSTVQELSAPEAGIIEWSGCGCLKQPNRKRHCKIAVGSKDHTTLVAALQQADYVDDLSNAGPFTVFAPTNEAFATIAGSYGTKA